MDTKLLFSEITEYATQFIVMWVFWVVFIMKLIIIHYIAIFIVEIHIITIMTALPYFFQSLFWGIRICCLLILHKKADLGNGILGRFHITLLSLRCVVCSFHSSSISFHLVVTVKMMTVADVLCYRKGILAVSGKSSPFSKRRWRSSSPLSSCRNHLHVCIFWRIRKA